MSTPLNPDRTTVEEVLANEIRRGDEIWAPDDHDWLLVDRITTRTDWDEVTFYRRDHSEATFQPWRLVLKRFR